MLSIIIPFYNEEKNIPLILERCRSFVGKYDFELICVDNGSFDNTHQVLENYLQQAEYQFAKMVWVKKNIGYGYGIWQGVLAAQGDIIAWTHADWQTDPADVFRALDLYRQSTDKNIIIKGNRVKRTWSQVIFSFGMAMLASIILKRIFFEINAQPKLFPRNFLKKLDNPPNDFSLDLYLLYQAKKYHYRITAIDVEYKKRLYGESKWSATFFSKYKTIMRTIKYIWQLQKREF